MFDYTTTRLHDGGSYKKYRLDTSRDMMEGTEDIYTVCSAVMYIVSRYSFYRSIKALTMPTFVFLLCCNMSWFTLYSSEPPNPLLRYRFRPMLSPNLFLHSLFKPGFPLETCPQHTPPNGRRSKSTSPQHHRFALIQNTEQLIRFT